jgi:hypothetical protein
MVLRKALNSRGHPVIRVNLVFLLLFIGVSFGNPAGGFNLLNNDFLFWPSLQETAGASTATTTTR